MIRNLLLRIRKKKTKTVHVLQCHQAPCDRISVGKEESQTHKHLSGAKHLMDSTWDSLAFSGNTRNVGYHKMDEWAYKVPRRNDCADTAGPRILVHYRSTKQPSILKSLSHQVVTDRVINHRNAEDGCILTCTGILKSSTLQHTVGIQVSTVHCLRANSKESSPIAIPMGSVPLVPL
jgi:hypothetical protein